MNFFRLSCSASSISQCCCLDISAKFVIAVDSNNFLGILILLSTGILRARNRKNQDSSSWELSIKRKYTKIVGLRLSNVVDVCGCAFGLLSHWIEQGKNIIRVILPADGKSLLHRLLLYVTADQPNSKL
ncbi:hypothetical protein Droror1_Dr00005308 [Drosera rotundifolia]